MPADDPGSPAQPEQASAGPTEPDPGQPGAAPTPAQLAREALARARAGAQARGDTPAGGTAARSAARGAPAGPGGRPRRPRRDDPQPLTTAIHGLIGDQGWQTSAAVGSVFGRWAQIVGADLAAHTRPDRFTDGELLVIADSTAWATQVRLLAGTLVRRLNSELGEGTVTRVKVRGPEQPRRPGQWRVRGSRGPRDTYG